MEHINKENYILFDKADQVVTNDEDQKIVDAFQHYEAATVGAERHEWFRRTIERLASKYLATAVP